MKDTVTKNKKLRVLHSTFSLTRKGGGVYEVLKDLTQQQSRSGDLSLKVVGPADDDYQPGEWSCESAAYPVLGPRAYGYSTELRQHYRSFEPDLAHLHGIWMHYSRVNLQDCIKEDRPYVVSPHGMLDRWALQNSRWKKRVVRCLFEDRHLKNATCLHALCDSEAVEFRRLGLKAPICVIPNGVTIPPRTSMAPKWQFETGRPVMLFLSRLHPKKGLLEFLSAWHKTRDLWKSENWGFAIAGWDQSGYQQRVQEQIAALGLESDVELIGPVFGEEKTATLQNASAFVLPSFSEGLPVSILEAWAAKLPVVMTDQCNLPIGFSSGAAVQVSHEPTGLLTGMSKFFDMSQQERASMGMSGRDLVESHFTWRKVAAKYLSLYHELTGRTSRNGIKFWNESQTQ